MSFIQTTTGPTKNATSTNPFLRGGNSGELIVADAHARYQEMAYRGNLFSITSAYGGTVLAAAAAIGQTAWAPSTGLYNPLTSGVNLVIIKGVACWVSGTPGAGGVVWGYIGSPAGVTSAGTATGLNMGTLQVGGCLAKTFVATVMTASAASVMLMPFCSNSIAAALATTTGNSAAVDEVAGHIVVPPGAAIGICGAAGSSAVVQTAIYWEEIPI